MKRFLLSSVATLALFLVAAPSQAVDVSNLDETTWVLTVNEDGNELTLEIFGGETLEGVCEKCRISTDDGQSLDLSGPQIAYIKGGKLTPDQPAD